MRSMIPVAVILSVGGDLLARHAGRGPEIAWKTVAVAAMVYGSLAVVWTLILRGERLVVAAMLYDVLQTLLLVGIGVVVLGEPLSAREALGVALGVASIILLIS